MANIKISELNEILKKDNADVLAIVDTSADETKKITVEDLLDKNVELIAVTDTEPAECSYGDKYFNTTDNLIYTAIATDTWGEDGEEPISGILYIVYSEQASYSWNGTELISVGGGKEDIVIDDEEPTDPDVKLWIDTGEIGSAVSEITNEYSTSTGIGYSANYVNNLVETIQIQSTIEFTSYQSIITNNTLGVDDCTDYIWYVQATGQSWEYMPIISQVTSSQILLRCWKLNGTGSANVSLLNNASILLLITGIKKI